MFFFFFNDTATTEIYTLSLHDALPICTALRRGRVPAAGGAAAGRLAGAPAARAPVVHLGRSGHGGAGGRPGDAAAAARSEEHTSELQSRQYLVCRLLLEKKKKCEHPVS